MQQINRVLDSNEKTYNTSVVQHNNIAKELLLSFNKITEQNEEIAAYLVALFNRVWSNYA